jgi:hypothetical protein
MGGSVVRPSARRSPESMTFSSFPTVRLLVIPPACFLALSCNESTATRTGSLDVNSFDCWWLVLVFGYNIDML